MITILPYYELFRDLARLYPAMRKLSTAFAKPSKPLPV